MSAFPPQVFSAVRDHRRGCCHNENRSLRSGKFNRDWDIPSSTELGKKLFWGIHGAVWGDAFGGWPRPRHDVVVEHPEVDPGVSSGPCTSRSG
jgi:hypothetical protein